MKEIKFATKVAMKVTEDQYHRDLEKPLLDMGYIYTDYYSVRTNMQYDYRYLTNYHSNQFSIRFDYRAKVEDNYLIEDYNPQLFLALAAMTEGEDWIGGEWLFFETDDVLFKVKSTDGNYNDYTQGLATNNKDAKTAYRKATKEEIIKHFNKKLMGNKFKVGDRFPFKLTEEDTKRIINIACEGWKLKLSKKWGKDILLKGYTEVSDDFYNEMRSYCTDMQHALFDKIFGKDEDIIPDGTPCLTRDNVKLCWELRYADGNGMFYGNGKKSGRSTPWNYYQVLDINNLPVNE